MASQCLQRLVHGGRLLADEAKLDGAMDLQLVLRTISCLPRHIKAVAARDLADAAYRNHAHIVRCLLEAADKDWCDYFRRTALMLASGGGHSEVACLLAPS